MNTIQLLKRLKKLPNFLGVFPCDLLPQEVKKTCGLIANTDPHYMSGEHWIGIYIENGRGEFFDSLGFPPQQEFFTFLNRNCFAGWEDISHRLQEMSPNSTVCGNYCLVYLHFRLLGLSFHHFINSFSNIDTLNDYIVLQIDTVLKKIK